MVSGSALLVRDSYPVQASRMPVAFTSPGFCAADRTAPEKYLFHNNDKRAKALDAASQSGAILDDHTADGPVHKQSQEQLLLGLVLSASCSRRYGGGEFMAGALPVPA